MITELNKYKMSIEEIIKMAHNYGCLYEGTLNEEYSEETLLKDLKKQLTLTDVSQQRELLAKYTKWQNEVNYGCDELMYADIDKFLNG